MIINKINIKNNYKKYLIKLLINSKYYYINKIKNYKTLKKNTLKNKIQSFI